MEVLLKVGKPLEESEEAMEEALRLLLQPGVDRVVVKVAHYLLEYRDEIPLLKAFARIAKEAEGKKLPCSLPLWTHPVGAYLKGRRCLMEKRVGGEESKELEEIVRAYEGVLAPYEEKLAGRDWKDRSIYYILLSPYRRVPYSGVKVKLNPPSLPLREEYSLKDGSRVEIYGRDGELYFITPAEFQRPYDEEVEELRSSIGVEALLNRSLLEEMANSPVVARNVGGLGAVEAFFLDEMVEDVYVNGPDERVVVKHKAYGEVPTNIYVDGEELERWASLLRLITGRPFDELTPVIDGSLPVEGKVRFSGVREPLSKGLAFAFRKHRKYTYTLPALVKGSMLSPKEASLLWMLVHGGRSLLIAGPRGAGKTTLLSALLLELLPQHRIIAIEDTPELPIEEMKALGYNVLGLLTRQVIGESFGLKPEEVLRASLRLGDSALVVGEVRGEEAKVLYEAMRVGALSSFVGGTIHAESPYGVYDRVVNDLGVKESSFKATDVVVMLTLRQDLAHRRFRRAVEGLYYVEKKWREEPSFQPLEESPLLEVVAKRHGLSKEEMEEVLGAREDYYRYLSLKGVVEAPSVVEANKMFMESIEKGEGVDRARIMGLFKESFRI